MPTKPGGYFVEGKRVPSVTTIISRWKDSGALIWWANMLAYEPYREVRALLERTVTLGRLGAFNEDLFKDCEKHLTKPENFCDFRVARDTAAGIGTIVHHRIDCHIRQQPCDLAPYTSDLVPDPMLESESGFSAFLQWAGSISFKLEEGEMPLASKMFGYGGTLDVIVVNGEKTVGDFKTGDLYPEQVLPQLAAYRQLLIENGRAVSEGGHAISINKKSGGFVHRYFTPEEMALGWEVFSTMLKLYKLIKQVK